MKKNGVKVVSAKENISEGPEGIILESMLEGYAEYYSADLAEKVVRGMTDNALKCKFNGGTIPIGYVIDDEALDGLLTYYNMVQMTRAMDAGNGRLVRNKIEDAILNQSRRLVAEPDADLSLLKLMDFELDDVNG